MTPEPVDDSPPADAERLRTDLLARFEELLPRNSDLAEDLLQRYVEPHRHYHGLAHLADVLDRIDEFATGKHDLFTVRLAAWFHDAVYAVPPGQISNEEASARLAIRTLGRSGFEQEEIGEIARLVRLTETHRPAGSDPNGELLCDADLAILATPPEEYRHYVAAIRQEYAGYSDQEFDHGRLQVLRNFGGREIFRTTAGRKLGPDAQRNLANEALELINRLGIADQLDPESWPMDQH